VGGGGGPEKKAEEDRAADLLHVADTRGP